RFVTSSPGESVASALVTVPSYEDRFLCSLDRACETLRLKRVTFLLFQDYLPESEGKHEVDSEAALALRANYAEAQVRLKRRGIGFDLIETKLDDLTAFSSAIRGLPWDQTALDISTMPRSYILTTLRFASP